MSFLLETRALAVRRGKRPVLEGIDLAVSAGEALSLIGPNAAGKSTLVRALAGLLPAERGQILIDGRPLRSWARDALACTVALVASEDEGPSLLTVRERVMLGRYPHRGPFRRLGGDDQAAVARAIAETGIEALAERRIGSLSAGERQLSALARGLAQEPRLLLLDEPAAHLDIGHQIRLFRVLDAIRTRGVAVLAVIHDLQRASDWAARMLLLANGRLAADGSPETVLTSEACGRAFGVVIQGHRIGGQPQALLSFEERSPR